MQPQPPSSPARARGFTLIELLGVMSIIIILAGLSVGVSSYVFRNATESRTRAEVKAIEVALEAYKQDNGGYPPLTSTPGDFTGLNSMAAYSNQANIWLYRALSPTNGRKVYMNFIPKQLNTNAAVNLGGLTVNTILKDPMGNPYCYNPNNPTFNPQTFDLWSAGMDGKTPYPSITSTNDDIGNWQR